MYTAPSAGRKERCCAFQAAKMAFPNGPGAGKQYRWTPILTQCPNRKKNWCLKGYRHFVNPPQTSPTPPLPRKNVQHACCTLYSMPLLHTVWCGNQCSSLCFACYAVVLPCIICILVMRSPPCATATVQKCQCGCELAGGGEALPDLLHSHGTVM